MGFGYILFIMKVAVVSDRREVIRNFLREIKYSVRIEYHPITDETDIIGRRFDSVMVLHYTDEERIIRLLHYLQPCLATTR